MRTIVLWAAAITLSCASGCTDGDSTATDSGGTALDSGANARMDVSASLDRSAPNDQGTTPPNDNGTVTPNEAGTPPGDTGTMPGDTGTMPGDTGTMPGDTGTMPGDTGTMPPDDTGSSPGDSGAMPGDDVVKSGPDVPQVISTEIAGEVCENSFDDDGDGMVNEGCPCTTGERMPCYSGRPDEAGGTRCQYGSMLCDSAGFWGACTGQGHPEAETCNGLDDNCDGDIDETCTCPMEGASRSCFAGPIGVGGVGVCRNGSQVCGRDTAGALRWGSCDGMIVPNFESCNGHDDDCDGEVDENCACTLGDNRPCYEGASGTAGRGICHGGFQRCLERADGGSVWSRCYQSTSPSAERCNGADDNCDGRIDEDCACTAGTTQPCYNGPPGTAGRGACAAGRMTCGSDLRSGACVGQVLPTNERCNGIDDNCDGRVDEACFCPSGQRPVYRFRPPPATAMCGLQMGDGLPIMVRTCEPTSCAESEVLAERFDGSTACVEPPPDCPAGFQPSRTREGVWRCDRGCEMVVRFGGVFGTRAVCTERPPTSCASGCFRVFRPELDQWRCGPRCAGGAAAIRLGSINVCLPCPNPPGMIIRPRD